MAENFDLIFGQSASAQTAWSDDDYLRGWETVGSIPPTAQQFDALQRRADLKSQNLNNRLGTLERTAKTAERQPSTTYTAGAVVDVPDLPELYYLACSVGGTTSSSVLTLPSTIVEGDTITDGSVTWIIVKVPTKKELGYRQPGKAQAVGDIVRLSALNASKKLVCVKAGTTRSGSLTVSSTAEGALITDGSVVWEIDSLADGIYEAAHQNGMYRGADLTAYWESGYMSINIQAGRFVGMHIGDYVVKTVNLPAITYTDKSGETQTQDAQTFNNVKWLLAAFDPHLHCGDTETTAHHVLIIPASTLQRNVSMNPTDSTEGGYFGSDMWKVHMPNWAAGIKAAFGEAHVLSHHEILTNAVNVTAPSGAGAGLMGSSTGWTWTTVEVNIPNETMVYGSRVLSSSGLDVGDFPRQLPLYALKCGHLDDRSWFCLRAVVSAFRFAIAYDSGHALSSGASFSRADGGVRPYSLLY